jgi:hypothetical protein
MLATIISAQDSEVPSSDRASQETRPDSSRSIYGDIPQFGGPSSVGGQLAEDAAVAPEFRWQGLQDVFETWYAFKEGLNERCGLQFNIDESMFYQVAKTVLAKARQPVVSCDSTGSGNC